MSEVLDLARDLIGRASVTPDDAGCQALLAGRLQRASFACEHLRFGAVDNLWATHGSGAPVLVLLGHTDVVPPGPREAWASDPFTAEIRDGVLYGRGAADMKGSVAAFMVAAERFAAAHPHHAGTLALLLTSDEEGDAIDGVRRVADTFRARGERIDWCITGEPSSKETLGDLLRIGRRAASSASAGSGANNVIPGELQVLFNLRYNPTWRAEALEAECEAVLRAHGLDYVIRWHRSGEPFYTPEGPLRAAAREVLAAFAGEAPEESTGGGTSDARFIAPLGAQCIEIGPVNASIHKVDEHVLVADLERLPGLYLALIERLLS
jgi:succinyl-diaminopimelate desuccinylase